MSTSNYWSQSEAQKVRKLEAERKKLESELNVLRQRDILKQQIARAKKEKFYRSPGGKIYLGTAAAIGGIKRELQKPETKKAMTKVERDIGRLWKKL